MRKELQHRRSCTTTEYDAAHNQPSIITDAMGNTTCTYDTMGRRAVKKVEANGETTLHQRYLYRGYLQVAACDLTSEGTPCLGHIMWDPTQPIATRPLAIRQDGTWYTYGWDLTKNVCELFNAGGTLATTYTYTPYGEVTTSGNTVQPLQWSSEYSDAELGIVYYNYRFYNSLISNWLNRDYISERQNRNSYNAFLNAPINHFDLFGLSTKGKDFDGYHPKLGACNAKKDCIYNYERLREWIIAAINRRRDDFTHECVAKGNKANWDKHRNQYKEILKQAGLRLSILEEQLRNNKCCPRLPQYDSVREWREEYDKLDDPGEYPVLPDSQVSPWVLGLELALLALVAGQAGPQALAPEEIVTVPGAFVAGVLMAL